MKMELHNYAVSPIVFPVEKEVTITIRPLGAHVAFQQKEYEIRLMDIDNLSSTATICIQFSYQRRIITFPIFIYKSP